MTDAARSYSFHPVLDIEELTEATATRIADDLRRYVHQFMTTFV